MNKEHTITADIIIAGGGMSGVSAALSAAKAGAKVMLIEQRSYLGGTATGALVTPLMLYGIYAQDGTRVVSGNLDIIFKNINNHSDYSFNSEVLKCDLDKLLLDMNVNILFNTIIYDIEQQDGRIQNILAVNKSGISRFRAKVFIDATGDADLAYKAHIPCELGRKGDGLTQATSLRFNLGNVDIVKARHYMNSEVGKKNFKQIIEDYNKNSAMEILDTEGFQNFIIDGRKNELAFNCPRIIGINATDANDLSKAYVIGRKKIFLYYTLLKENIPGCENAYISNIAELLGIRESRRIQGEYVLTDEDVISGRKFSDGIACNSWFIDIHNPSGKGVLGYDGNQQKVYLYPSGGWNDIPYRCLYSKKIKNLLVAGRCISATHEAQAAIRIMASCIAMGQAAGTAAYIMLDNDSDAANIEVASLRKMLAEDGALITGCNL